MDQAMEITKIKNIYIMLLHAISQENISIVDHCLDDALTAKYKQLIETNIQKNVKQVFRQLNITNLHRIQQDDEYVTYEGLVRYITYYVDRQNNKYVSGDNKTRISKNVVLKFKKNDINSRTIFKCPNCGAGLKINATSICTYCGSSIDERYSPYVLCSIL